MVHERDVDLVVVYDPDRLARNLSHQLLLTEEFEQAGVRLEFVDFEWRDTPEGKLFYSLRGAIAEYEKEKIKERTVRGKRQKARQGGIMSVPRAYGYRWDKLTKSLEVDEDEAKVVRHIFDLYVNRGLGSEQIARRLAAEGVRPKRGQFWHRATVIRIIQNEIYTGVYYQNRWDTEGGKPAHRFERPRQEWIAVSVPPIISRDLWEAAQRVTEANRLDYSRHVRHDYLLSGLLYCWCGSRMSAGQASKGGVKYYTCQRKFPWHHRVVTGEKYPPRCPSRYVRQEDADRLVWQGLVDLLSDPRLFLAELLRRRTDPAAEEKARRRIAELESCVEGVKRQKLQIVRFSLAGLISEEEASALLAEQNGRLAVLEQDLAGARASLESLKQEAQFLEDAWQAALKFSRRLVEPDALTFGQKREILQLLVKKVVAQQDGTLVVHGFLPIDVPRPAESVSSSHAQHLRVAGHKLRVVPRARVQARGHRRQYRLHQGLT
ncbi:MAG: recombinase family protein, partial [Bacillota bacterium]